MAFRMECCPAFNYARDAHETTITPKGVTFHSRAASLQLSTTLPLEQKHSGATADFTLNEGQTVTFALGGTNSESEDNTNPLSEPEAERLFRMTVEYWRRWIAQSSYCSPASFRRRPECHRGRPHHASAIPNPCRMSLI